MTATAQSPKIDQRQNDYTNHAAGYEQKRFSGRENAYLESLRRRAVLRGLRGCAPTSCILDVGCGTGRGLQYLTSAGFERVTGLDYTAAMLEQARSKQYREFRDGAVQLLRGDAFRLPFEDERFDIVMSLNFLHMFRLELQQELVGEMARVCRPNGRVVVELESIHKGLFVTRYWEQRRLHQRTKFNGVFDLPRLFPRSTFSRPRVRGTALPKVYKAFSRIPEIGARIESVTCCFPFNWMAERVIVAADKCQA